MRTSRIYHLKISKKIITNLINNSEIKYKVRIGETFKFPLDILNQSNNDMLRQRLSRIISNGHYQRKTLNNRRLVIVRVIKTGVLYSKFGDFVSIEKRDDSSVVFMNTIRNMKISDGIFDKESFKYLIDSIEKFVKDNKILYENDDDIRKMMLELRAIEVYVRDGGYLFSTKDENIIENIKLDIIDRKFNREKEEMTDEVLNRVVEDFYRAQPITGSGGLFSMG